MHCPKCASENLSTTNPTVCLDCGFSFEITTNDKTSIGLSENTNVAIKKKPKGCLTILISLLIVIFIIVSIIPGRSDLSIASVNYKTEYNYCYFNGRIKNKSNKTIHYYEIKVKFYNSEGDIISNEATNNHKVSLGPKESQDFKIVHAYTDDIDHYKLFIEHVY